MKDLDDIVKDIKNIDKSVKKMKNLDDLIKDMKSAMRSRDLSDSYLRENGCSDREEIGIGEYSYGISMIPCSWVYQHLLNYSSLIANIKDAIENDSIDVNTKEYGNLNVIDTDILNDLLEETALDWNIMVGDEDDE